MNFGWHFSWNPTGNLPVPVAPTAAPTVTSAPVITGTPQSGQTLTADNGVFTQSPSSYAYQWLASGAAIAGATTRQLVLADNHIAKTISVTVTATNSFGSAPSTSAATTAVTAAPVTQPPVNSVAPVISGTPQTGSTLSTTNGTWTNSPTGYTYVWSRGGSVISGATSATYVLTLADVGLNVSATVTATNAYGSATAVSNSIGPITRVIPVATAAPVVSGTTNVGQTLTTTNGTWTNSPTSYLYQWFRNTVAIGGATSSTYVLVSDDTTFSISCQVIASNASGNSTAAASNSIGPITVAAPTILTNPVVSGTPTSGQTLNSTQGTYTGNPTSYTYAWRSNGTATGTTQTTYVLGPSDVGKTITCAVTATNAGGSVTAVSAGIGPIVAAAQSINIVTDGDSITFGVNSTDNTTKSYPAVAVASLSAGKTYTLQDIGTPSITALQIGYDYPTRAGAAYDATKDMNIFTIMAGTNDKTQSTANTDLAIFRNLRSTFRQARATGYQRRLVGTLISRNDGTAGDNRSFDANTMQLSTLLRTHFNNSAELDADGLFDFAANAAFDVAADATSANYSGDALHPSDAGYSIMGGILGPKLTSAISGPGTRTAPTPIWSPLDTSPSMVTTNSGRTIAYATGGGDFAQASAKGWIGKASGKWYFETVIDNSHLTCVGIMTEPFEHNVWDNFNSPQQDPYAIAWGWGSDQLTYNGSNVLALGALADGDIVQHAFDATARQYWIRRNNGNWNGSSSANPATGVGGVDITAIGTGPIYPVGYAPQQPSQITARFAAAQMTGTIPSGFAALG